MSAPMYKRQPQRCDPATEGAHSHHRKGTRGSQSPEDHENHYFTSSSVAEAVAGHEASSDKSHFSDILIHCSQDSPESTADNKDTCHSKTSSSGRVESPSSSCITRVSGAEKRSHGVLKKLSLFPSLWLFSH